MQGTSREGSVIGAMNVERTGILGVLRTSLDRMGHGSVRMVRIVKKSGLEKFSLIQYNMIS